MKFLLAYLPLFKQAMNNPRIYCHFHCVALYHSAFNLFRFGKIFFQQEIAKYLHNQIQFHYYIVIQAQT
ncbi:hypothetical protein EB796_002519 [Bugula neritina]|uniref:Uncharacterized protein n=1 Tax=Bugula neritina TaxID=10212 RepID=A0A7J7KM02_BUGNE|nr:hypothetical protein EB796_002519 [Bugula neritina]